MRPGDRLLSPSDVMQIMSVSRAEANRIMHEFEQAGKLFRRGRLLRVLESDFNRWVGDNIKHNSDRVMQERQKIIRIAN